jgi:hypothetical protein
MFHNAHIWVFGAPSSGWFTVIIGWELDGYMLLYMHTEVPRQLSL